jgi:hypothetical protein
VFNAEKSNITIASNIQNSQNYRENVIYFDELVKLANKFGPDRFTKEQVSLYSRGAKPYYCTNHNEQAWGFIKTQMAEIVQSCRCEKPYSHFDECMSEPHAKKIVRKKNDILQDENKLIEEPNWVAAERILS